MRLLATALKKRTPLNNQQNLKTIIAGLIRNLSRLENCDICANFDMNTCIVKRLAHVGQLNWQNNS